MPVIESHPPLLRIAVIVAPFVIMYIISKHSRFGEGWATVFLFAYAGSLCLVSDGVAAFVWSDPQPQLVVPVAILYFLIAGVGCVRLLLKRSRGNEVPDQDQSPNGNQGSSGNVR